MNLTKWRIFRDSAATPFGSQRALWSHCGCRSYARKHSDRNSLAACSSAKLKRSPYSPLPLALVGMCGTLQQAPWTLPVSRNLLPNSPANVLVCTIPGRGRESRMQVKGAFQLGSQKDQVFQTTLGQKSQGNKDKELPVYKERGVCNYICMCTGMPQRPFRERTNLLCELHSKSFAEGFKPTPMVPEYITPCKTCCRSLAQELCCGSDSPTQSFS